ncbi:MAG: hypothetical protein V7K98_02935 [Nostoc sp.]
MSICSLNSLIPSSAKAQAPDGRYEIQGTQILFYPATGGDPLLVYKGTGKATQIINYNGAIYTAFEGGRIYRSPDGQGLGGSGRTTLVYSG